MVGLEGWAFRVGKRNPGAYQPRLAFASRWGHAAWAAGTCARPARAIRPVTTLRRFARSWRYFDLMS